MCRFVRDLSHKLGQSSDFVDRQQDVHCNGYHNFVKISRTCIGNMTLLNACVYLGLWKIKSDGNGSVCIVYV